MPTFRTIDSVDSAEMDELCDWLRVHSGRWSGVSDWPTETLQACGQAGVYRWFLPVEMGGFGWSAEDQTRGYLRLSEADLTTTFIITQYMGAIRRIASSSNEALILRWLESMVSGESFGTLGISHLTTSGRHLSNPILAAKETDAGFVLDGLSPWVTGGPHADVYVVGATLDDGRQILAAAPRNPLAGQIKAHPGYELVALSASCTDRVEFDNVLVDDSMMIAGPAENVMQGGSGARTGGLQTSTLAVGLARAAIHFLVDEATRREDLLEPTSELEKELHQLEATLIRAAKGEADCDASEIRGSSNAFVMRATQAAMTAAKGAGFVEGHRVGRWCQQALFFLVWSCPQNVAQAHLCELAGVES